MKSKDRAAQEPKLLKLKAAPRRTSASPIPSWSTAATVLHPPRRALHRCLVIASGALVSTTTPHHRAVDPTFEPWLNRAVRARLVARCMHVCPLPSRAGAQTRRRLRAGHRAEPVDPCRCRCLPQRARSLLASC
jgi:hypothetical protein